VRSNRPISSAEAAAKRVSWVELYFDLIFVFAVGQLSHLMVADPLSYFRAAPGEHERQVS
jgi:low temperature requirement protein LtrA